MADPGELALGYEGTRLASERTLMAWVRTAVSLIGFGFSIPKFFAFLPESQSLAGAPGLSPRVLGVLLIALGTLGLAGGIVEHLQLLRRIAPDGRAPRELPVALIAESAMTLVGLLAFLNVLVS
jgi:putative membrane protein